MLYVPTLQWKELVASGIPVAHRAAYGLEMMSGFISTALQPTVRLVPQRNCHLSTNVFPRSRIGAHNCLHQGPHGWSCSDFPASDPVCRSIGIVQCLW